MSELEMTSTVEATHSPTAQTITQPITSAGDERLVRSGDWRVAPYGMDYRVEQPGDMLVERITWDGDTPAQTLGGGMDDVTIAAPHFVWFRFWLTDEGQIVEKYFNDLGEPVGVLAPIGRPFDKNGGQLSTSDLLLTLWIGADERVTLLHEEAFDDAVAQQELTPVEIDFAERRVRNLTTSIAQKQFPPSLVRNLELKK